MKKHCHKFDNNFMGREFYMWSYGHYGKPIFVFPSSAGMAHEWESEGMVEMLEPLINEGKLKLYCVESNVAETWNNKHSHPADFIKKHQAYEEFIINNIVPFIYQDCGGNELPLMTTGVSLGAFYAINHTLKYPHIFTQCIAMSGRYEISSFCHGFMNEDLYFNNPLAYLAQMEGEPLQNIQSNTEIILTCGRGSWEGKCLDETIALGEMLQQKGIRSTTDIWGYESAHDWDWWKAHFAKHFPEFYAKYHP